MHRTLHTKVRFATFLSGHTSKTFNKWTKISSLEIDIFDLKMMVKSGVELFILKFTEASQSCYFPVQKNLPRKAVLRVFLQPYSVLRELSQITFAFFGIS